MDVSIFRDYVIVIGGLLLIVLTTAAGILAFLLYRQIKNLSTSFRNTINLTKETASELKQTVKTAKDLAGIFKGNKEQTPTPPPGDSSN